MSSDDPYIGLWILDQYRVTKILGKGGMGRVYLAEQPTVDRKAVIKFLHKGMSVNDRRRFRREARAASRLSHPNIVTIYNYGEADDGVPFLAMEYIDGTSLHEMIHGSEITPLRAINLAYQLAAALAYAHNKQVVHRDFKPRNVIVSHLMGREHVKVLDFGLAKVLDDPERTQSDLMMGVLIGTPEHMSPEQCHGQQATRASDQYALGLILYEMLANRPAIMAKNPLDYVRAHREEEPAALCVDDSPPALKLLEPLVLKMLAKDPEERFARMEEVQQELRSVAENVIAGPVEKTSTTPNPLLFEGATDSARTVEIFSHSTELQRAPSRTTILLAGEPVLSDEHDELLRMSGFEVTGRHRTAADWQSKDTPPTSFVVLGATHADWQDRLKEWIDSGYKIEQLIIAMEPLTELDELVQLASGVHNLLFTSLPADPQALLGALHGLSAGAVLETIAGDESVESLAAFSSEQKAETIAALMRQVEHMQSRPAVRQAVNDIAEEMVINALFHAPVDERGQPRNRHLDRRSAVTLAPGEQALLQWTLKESFVALSIRDPFGSADPAELLSSALGARREPTRKGQGGLGLRIMARAARNLIFSLSPGSWFECVAMIGREPALATSRSLCMLRFPPRTELRIGNQLWYSLSTGAKGTQIRLRGAIDESSDLRPMFARAGAVSLDLSAVTNINSMGIYAWTNANRRRREDLDLRLERLSIAMVNRLNLRPDLAEGATITSLCVPYYCSGCDIAITEVVTCDEIVGCTPPQRKCSRCAAVLEFDALAEEFFSFLSSN